MNFYSRLAPALIGVSIAFVQMQVVVALSPPEVNKIAKEITVLIQSKKPRYGSGVIIKKEGNIYTVLTAAHVVDVADNYEIVTPDNRRYAVNYNTMKLLAGVDLAVVQFSSSQNYTMAKMGNSDVSTEGTTAYVAGFPAPTFAINQSIYTFSDGRITANASKALRDGYALVYSNNTSEGMSGGAVLNEKGELIGVHGRADLDTKESKTGFNLGIPINTFLRLSAKAGVDVGVRPPNTQVATAPKADDLYIQGGDKRRKGDFKGAIADYTEAIRLNPKYVSAYNDRGIARRSLRDNQGAIADYEQAIRLDPKYTLAYYNRGLVRSELGDNQRAIADYNQALEINPKYVYAYVSRGRARRNLGDQQGALADFDQAIRLNPRSALTYVNRGLVRSYLGDKEGAIADYLEVIRFTPKDGVDYYNRGFARAGLGDKQGALADYDQAISLNIKNVNIYNDRGNVRFNLGDKQGAIADYDQAIRLNPKYYLAYYNRARVRFALKDLQAAIADYSQAIRFNPKYAYAYHYRGNARLDLGDKQEGIRDLQQAAKLYLQEGNTKRYQQVLDRITKLQQ
ncbi:tetratricopeptide TPR_2 repeat protein [Tolypothrix sp. NIES-4075]|uniref:tetratricopeptide repeat-containing S1 family peptidase n=1 Tax=Tolypothrix sp. NIES-4075 TaxID=2005459 RepID=UPI000B5C71A4|nr:tetratricopeptide repeat-containing serine protease family protein [Tolypothrix sp. NIES-4075]GAX41804.1 tetratricopeptide TPR_2 repeat protein [Tolypothrix sp. NIES-4075]